MQVPECIGAVRIYNRLHVNLADSFQSTCVECVLAQQVTGSLAFYMSFLETGIGLFNGFLLRLRRRDFSRKTAAFQRKQPLIARFQSVLFQDLLDGWSGATHALPFEKNFRITAPFGQIRHAYAWHWEVSGLFTICRTCCDQVADEASGVVVLVISVDSLINR